MRLDGVVPEVLGVAIEKEAHSNPLLVGDLKRLHTVGVHIRFQPHIAESSKLEGEEVLWL